MRRGAGAADSAVVRPVEPSDRNEWLRMRSVLWPGEPAEHAAEIDAFLAGLPAPNPIAAVFVREDSQDRLTGFLELAVRDYAEGCVGPTPYVEGWYVDPEVRGGGVGSALMSAAEQWARQNGYAVLASDTELENRVSESAHRALGFEEVECAIHFRKVL